MLFLPVFFSQTRHLREKKWMIYPLTAVTFEKNALYMALRFHTPTSTLALALVLFAHQLLGQVFTGEPLSTYMTAQLSAGLSTYEVYRLDANAVNDYARRMAPGGQLTLLLGGREWSLRMEPSGVLPAGYFLKTGYGPEPEQSRLLPLPLKGYDQLGGGHTRLTLAPDFIYGYVRRPDDRWFIQPLAHLEPGAAPDLFIVYPESAVIDTYGGKCAVTDERSVYEDALQHLHDDGHDHDHAGRALACYELEFAIASDNSMVTKYGSPSAVEARNVGVINDVEGDYTGNFNHDVKFVIVTQFIPTGADPWTTSTNAATLLGSFRTWGNQGGFGIYYDLAQLWTNRNLDGSTIGIAYLNGVCNSNKYSVCQDFSSNSNLIRVLTSHEIGHNFNLQHDNGCPPPNLIMCPSVSNATNWSNLSISTMNSKLNQLINNGCLSPCNAGPPLEANFSWSPEPVCSGSPIQFSDQSLGNPTGWSWTFPGGTPASSTLQNPVVTWNQAGTYNVTLVVSRPGGSNQITQEVTVTGTPNANFTFTVSGHTVTFNNLSTPTTGVTYEWYFGDGLFSNEKDPIHTYDPGGFYTAELFVFNVCGSSTKSAFINTAPTADFSASPLSGCAPLAVQFNNESTPNATSFVWQFPGGSPATTTQQNPVVTYASSGTFSVTLTAINSQGSSTVVKNNYITVGSIPTANYTYAANGLTVTFTNQSVGATSYLWNFGDGNTSTQANPVHTYAIGGVYTVTLTSTNNCGNTVVTKTVVLADPPTAGFTLDADTACAPLTATFFNASTGLVDSILWIFEGGTPSTSTADTAVVTFAAPGAYDVTLIAYGPGGRDTLSVNDLIVALGGPAASFNTLVSGATVAFNNTTSNGTSYQWSFGDGGTSSETNPVHTYQTDGVYTATLIAFNGCGADTATVQVTIVLPPSANFAAVPTSGCHPLTVAFNNLSSPNATGFEWSFPGGNPSSSTEANPVVTYNAPGVYSVTLIATNSAGSDTLVLPDVVVVNTVPSGGFSYVVNGPYVGFTNGANGADAFFWDFGDGNTSDQPNPAHEYATDGVYTVMQIVTNACGSDTSTATITIVLPPTAGFSMTNDGVGCAAFTVKFTNQSSLNAVSYDWSFPGGDPATSNEAEPVVTWSTPGTYIVTLVVTNTAGSSTYEDTVVVNDIPAASFTAQSTGLTVVFTNTSQNATQYFWTFGDGNTSNEANPVHTYTIPGMYVVTLQATNACGTDEESDAVEMMGAPPSGGFGASETSGCTPFSVQFSDQSLGAPTSWDWSFQGGNPPTSKDQNPIVVYNTPGTFSVVLRVTNAWGEDEVIRTDYVTVQTFPTVQFSHTANGLTAVFTNTSANASTYLWNFGDGNTSNEANPTHTYGTPGTYTVSLTATNECGASTIEKPVVLTGVRTTEPAWVTNFQLFPNPSTGSFRVDMQGEAQGEIAFILFNELGQMVKRDETVFFNGHLSHALHYPNLAPGFYVLRMQAQGDTWQVPVVIQR